eukprot:TRINITY_DN9397_c0_g3_i1.p1 TRINITY_DN9397_c0_g3~~TRINITY_DN9397_c0_g3_i1.p1  ORF type:complete len:403 (+),score=78.37 TRINITY_DN9397_c0_g3_i1:121-1329(+)
MASPSDLSRKRDFSFMDDQRKPFSRGNQTSTSEPEDVLPKRAGSAAGEDMLASCPATPIAAMAESGKKLSGTFSLELMRAASPPRIDSLSDKSDASQGLTAQYLAWKAKHPSALDGFESLVQLAEGKQVAVFLDYDGTLSPIVEDPERAFMSEPMREVVKEVAALCPTAIISGRGREKVYDFVKIANLYYAGSHGMDIMGPKKTRNGVRPNGTLLAASEEAEEEDGLVCFQPASEYVNIMDEVYKKLKENTALVSGSSVENNKFCISVHFRRVQEASWEELASVVETVLQGYPNLHMTQGRKVMEIRPSLDWHKGKAVAFLLQALGLESTEEVLPLYIGDDRTDEDAFRVLKERGMGCGIIVTTTAKNTLASYSLRDPDEVMTFLQRLVKWRSSLANNASLL